MKKIYLFIMLFAIQCLAFDVTVTPDKAGIGDVFVVEVNGVVKGVTIGKSTFPCYRSGENTSRTIMGVPSWWETGVYGISIEKEKTGKTVEFVKKEFPSEEIQLPPEKTPENAETKKQVEFITEKIRTRTEKKLWNGKFDMPVKGRISSSFGFTRKVNGKEKGVHRGLDIAAPSGTEVSAPNSGTVLLAGEFILSGKTIVIDHGQGVISIFMHQSELLVKENDTVEKGKVIGKVGTTGASTGPHLHWGMYVFGIDVDPTNFVNNEY